MVGVLAAACKPKNSAGPAPFRPEASATEIGTVADCAPTNPDEQSTPLRFGERSIAEAARLVERARDEYAEAMTTELSQPLRLEALHRTLETLHTALAADPYNVDATYLLAAAYARVQRKQCTLNLLERLLEMKHHHSRSAAVERRLDSLLGRRGTPLDTSFDGLRRDAGFRELIAEMCRDENDADCVHGAP
ncbi:MAG: hypothetical protein IPL79_03255 [Myxococcales bacterium]|nr:hypothetical protein [Myxococcales bacterium]